MRFKTIHIAIGICLAIFFKLSFGNIVFFAIGNSSLSELLTTNQIFKVGKQRRRNDISISIWKENLPTEEFIFAEKAEIEDNNEILKKLKLPILCFFSVYLSSLNSLVADATKDLSAFFDRYRSSLPSKKFIAISILRI